MAQRIIGLTGGIATGKSTVSDYLADQYGLPVLDADHFAREAVEPGTTLLTAIAQRYGPTVVTPPGTLNRGELGRIIFHNAAEKSWVEQQIHPFVRQRFAEEMARLTAAPVVVQAIPLLFEADLTDQVTEIWVVACTAPAQLKRLVARDHLTPVAAQARIDNQWPLPDKIARADVVLDNNGALPQLYGQIDRALAA